MPKSKQQKRLEAAARQVAYDIQAAQWIKDYDECFSEVLPEIKERSLGAADSHQAVQPRATPALP